MKSAVQHLTVLCLDIMTRIPDDGSGNSLDGDDHHSQIPVCAEYLKESGRLRHFVIAAPNLRVLDIGFDMETPQPQTGFKDVVGDFTWHSLQRVGFQMQQTTEDELVDFYSRHAGTLSEIPLSTIGLTEGSWPGLLHRMRKTLRLKKAGIYGKVYSCDPEEGFDFGLPPFLSDDNMASGPSSAVEGYLMMGGDGALLDLDALFDDDLSDDTSLGSDDDYEDEDSDTAVLDMDDFDGDERLGLESY